MNFIDILLIIFLVLGALVGFKKGLISSVVSLVGTILILILAYYLKNPISALMYNNLPFSEFSGALSGVTVLNIILYEAIAFFIAFAILRLLLNIVIKVSGILDTIIKWTFVLTIPAKLLGALIGLIEAVLFLFIVLYLANHVNVLNSYTKDSKIANNILYKTPFLSKGAGDAFKSVDEIYSLKEKYKTSKNGDEYNLEALDILLKYEVITPKSAKSLVEKGKIKTSGANDVINRYESEK